MEGYIDLSNNGLYNKLSDVEKIELENLKQTGNLNEVFNKVMEYHFNYNSDSSLTKAVIHNIVEGPHNNF